jgi:hypothetical protein
MNADNVNFSGSNPTLGQVTSNGQLLIGSTFVPHIAVGTITSPDGSITPSYSSPNITLQVSGGTTVGKTITGNSGGALSPVAGNWNIQGTGSITTSGSGNTLTPQLTGLTNHNVLLGAGTATITKLAPSATSGVPLISQGASSDPTFGTAVVAGGGTGIVTTTAYGLIAGGTTATGNFQNTGTGTSGQLLVSAGSSALPAWSGGASAGASWVLIQSQTASNSASISFTTGITNTYTNYVFVISDVTPGSDNLFLQMQVSTNGGSTYLSTGYASGNNRALSTQNIWTNTNTTTYMYISGAIGSSGPGVNATLWLSNIASSITPALWGNGMEYLGDARMTLYSGYNSTTSGVNAFQWTFSSGNITLGKFSLYGIRQS